jgi:hypothetical protein
MLHGIRFWTIFVSMFVVADEASSNSTATASSTWELRADLDNQCFVPRFKVRRAGLKNERVDDARSSIIIKLLNMLEKVDRRESGGAIFEKLVVVFAQSSWFCFVERFLF